LQAEETADGLFEGSDSLVSLCLWSLFPGDFEAFESSAEFQSLRLCGGSGCEEAKECTDEACEKDVVC